MKQAALMATFGLAVMLPACRDEVPPPAMPVTAASEDPLAAYPAAGEAEGIQPIDPAISADAASIEQRSATLEVRSRTLDPEQQGWEPRLVRGWFDEGRLVRLSVTEPTAAGGMSGESIWYLADAEVFLARTPDGIYKLDSAGQIVEWLDESGEPADASESERAARSRALQAAFQRWNDVLVKSSPVPPEKAIGTPTGEESGSSPG